MRILPQTMDAIAASLEERMWMKCVKITSPEREAYVTSHFPLRVRIPPRKIKVPCNRTKGLSPQARQTIRMRSNHLLMIKQSTNQISRHRDVIHEQTPPGQSVSGIRPEALRTPVPDCVMTQQHLHQNHCDANNRIMPQPVSSNNDRLAPNLPPSCVEFPITNQNRLRHKMNTIMTVQTDQQFHQNLSANTKAELSEYERVNTALKRLYNKASRLGLSTQQNSLFQAPEYQDMPANDAIPVSQRLADRVTNYTDRRMAPTHNSTASFVDHCQKPLKNTAHHVFAEVMNYPINQLSCVTRNTGEKRKFCDIAQPQNCKVPRLAQPVSGFPVRHDDVTISQFFDNNSFTTPPPFIDSPPPTYQSIRGSRNLFPGVFPGPPTNVGSDVMVKSSDFPHVFCLPSVLFSPTQARISQPFVVQ